MVAVPAWLAVALGFLWACSTPQPAPAAPVGREPSAAALAERVAAARARSRALPPTASEAELDALLTLQLGDPARFAADPAFRARVLELLPRALAPSAAPEVRARLLAKLNRIPGFDFAASERVETAWGAAPRASAAREDRYAPGLRFADETAGRLVASLYSFPSDLIERPEADALLAAVRALDPGRTLLALTDLPLAGGPRLAVLPSYGRPYSPWPRDPLSLVRAAGGGVVVLTRPNRQPTREEDLWMGRELVQNLPPEVDGGWGHVRWTAAPVPFHNGQVLLAGGSAWISLHAVELRALERLGLERVPVEELGTAAGVDRYMAAVAAAAAELGALYGRPVRFVHPLPQELAPAGRPALLRTLGGGAGYDLDSLLTLLSAPGGGLRALVADFALGRAVIARTTAAEWEAFRAAYGLAPEADRLAAALAPAQESARAAALQGFLDAVAAHLARQGIEVARLPLLLVPVPLLADPRGIGHPDFRITWNNVVVEVRDGRPRAEGFAALLPAGDRLAEQAFARAGTRLDLLPPLVRSVILTGGYRCASNHLREGTAGERRSAGVD